MNQYLPVVLPGGCVCVRCGCVGRDEMMRGTIDSWWVRRDFLVAFFTDLAWWAGRWRSRSSWWSTAGHAPRWPGAALTGGGIHQLADASTTQDIHTRKTCLAGVELPPVELHRVDAVDEPLAVRLEHVHALEAPQEVVPRHPEGPVAWFGKLIWFRRVG